MQHMDSSSYAPLKTLTTRQYVCLSHLVNSVYREALFQSSRLSRLKALMRVFKETALFHFALILTYKEWSVFLYYIVLSL
jgi:hypothetical protein